MKTTSIGVQCSLNNEGSECTVSDGMNQSEPKQSAPNQSAPNQSAPKQSAIKKQNQKKMIAPKNPQNYRQNQVRCHRRRTSLSKKRIKCTMPMVWRKKESGKRKVIRGNTVSKKAVSAKGKPSKKRLHRIGSEKRWNEKKRNASAPNPDAAESSIDRPATINRETESTNVSLSDRRIGESIEFSFSFFECAHSVLSTPD